ncbi:MAG TPA: type II toxin-antitoxin system RelE/ParE family toxin [Eoetvoesiella sp.]|uniref:type II toxin-antitoxin system RelE/ParE family toxin n=1 Tax=Eoetvoesiella sp. TaxID=1966355 RepID=UPI002B815B8D|nr:type II toxin-antitoxin system RelE/ParE family toxin [Eoetvoesiella sp.]HWK60338.1 type II toxin-antitoxin system RelE/ParE family toxin [Eoetvoesiella sp.]
MSSYRIQRTASANNDLLEAWLYVAEDSLDAADRLLDRIEADTRSLLEHPRMGRARDELAAGLRNWPTSTPYIAFYFLQGTDIIIARVLHHSRDILTIDAWPNR